MSIHGAAEIHLFDANAGRETQQPLGSFSSVSRVTELASYRVYKLDPARRIVAGEWIEAANDDAARQLAQTFSDKATPPVELWKGARQLAVLSLEEP